MLFGSTSRRPRGALSARKAVGPPLTRWLQAAEGGSRHVTSRGNGVENAGRSREGDPDEAERRVACHRRGEDGDRDTLPDLCDPLAAIGPVANAIGGALIGTNLVGVGAVRVPFTNAVVGAVIAFALSLLGTYVVARVIDY